MTQVPCAFCEQPPTEKIGDKGDTVDVYALRGGTAIDSVFQLGVAHAHIVAPDLPTPSLLVGVSLGAVHASAIAEILQAPAQLDPAERVDPVSRRAASLNRFREILFAYQDFAMELPGALPDAFEADAGRPLRPNPQAIHFQTERDSRQEALRARSGLIALVNDLFRQRITIRTMARLLRAMLGRKAASELPGWWRRAGWRTLEVGRFIQILVTAPRQCLQLWRSVTRAHIGGTARVLRSALESWHPSIARSFLAALLHPLEGRHSKGYTAGEIIFSTGRARIAPPLLLLSLLGVMVSSIGGWLVWWFVRHEPGFFFVCFLPALAALIACSLSDVWHELPSLREAWRASRAEKILAYYDLRNDLGNDYLVEELLIRLFDPTYHGVIDMPGVADRAMRGADNEYPARNHAARTFAAFMNADYKPMRVSAFVADLASGVMKENKADTPIVDGLRAAIATVPFLKPVANKESREFFLNGSNVANDATSPALDVLRLHLHPEVQKVRLFSVVPVTMRDRRHERSASIGTVEVGLAGLELSAFRDSHVDHEIVELYNSLVPQTSHAPERLPPKTLRALACFGSERHTLPDGSTEEICRHFVRSELKAIEPPNALHTTGKFLEAKTKTERQKIIAAAVAEGCRATLAAHFGRTEFGCRAMVAAVGDAPGAIEVCSHCTDYRPVAAARAVAEATPDNPPKAPAVEDTPASTADPAKESWKPKVNILFSGGVFRGVFQIGVLNALNELNVKPNVIAGSSVGSIVAAMVAHIFTLDDEARKQEIPRLASTFMTLDRLIITDRFADFVRRFTLRAAAARFSLRDADAFFRNYDASMVEFGSVARRVVGGIEHLFYVSPFKLAVLVDAFRQRNYSEAKRLICQYAQEACDRGLVGSEVLGAEPLALLIREHVLSARDRPRYSHAMPLSSIGSPDLAFLTTATNLSERKLEIFSSEDSGKHRAALIETLLASSAFPGVFRPRWSREILFHDNTESQFIDGGVLDNLPVSAVVKHLHDAAAAGKVDPRPHVPHLVLTASLEPEAPAIGPDEAARVARSWLAALDRARRLQYNQKIDRYAKVQRDLRYIWRRYNSVLQFSPIGADMLDIEVVVIKPKWLCDTFAFHPMLGFRRKTQAASIAHGCAATLSSFARIKNGLDDFEPHWAGGWAMQEKIDALGSNAIDMTPVDHGPGNCYFRENTPCPFASESLKAIPQDAMRSKVKEEVAGIHRACGRPETHTSSFPKTVA